MPFFSFTPLSKNFCFSLINFYFFFVCLFLNSYSSYYIIKIKIPFHSDDEDWDSVCSTIFQFKLNWNYFNK